MCKRIHLIALLLPLLLLSATGVQAQQTFSLSYQDYHADTLLVEVHLDAVSPQPVFPDANTRMAYDTANLVYVGHITEGTIFGTWPDGFTTSPDSVLVRCNPITGACVGEANYVGTNLMNTTYLQGPGLAMLIKFAYKAGYDYDSRETWMTTCSTRVGTAAWIYYRPEAPDVLSPAGGGLVDLRPEFSWTETAGPVGTYTLEYSTSPTFVSGVVVVPDIPTDPPGESWTPGTDLVPGTYYWRVTAYDHIGRPSLSSPIDSFEVQACPEAPDAPETSDNPVCVDSQYCLSWDDVQDASWYDIQMNGGPWDSIGSVPEICYSQSVAGDFTYRLRARKAGCDPAASVSDPVTVTVEAALEAPEAPTIVQSPPFCAPISFTLQWDIDPQATRYEFREVGEPWVNIGINDQRAVTKNDPGVYYFQLRACNDVCGCSEPSDSIEVLVLGTPETPVVSGPGSVCVGSEYCLYWPSDPMTQNYHVSTDGGATWPHGTSDTFFCATASDTGSVTYQVRACNSCGGCGDASNSVEVQEGPPEYPEAFAVDCRIDADSIWAEWPRVPGAEYYLILVDEVLLDSITDTALATELPPDASVFEIAPGNECAANRRGFSCVGSDVHEHSYEILPDQYSLSQNYPNPFNPETYVDFALPRASHVTLIIYNMLGQQVRTLVDEQLSAGPKTVTWNGTDDSGAPVSSGIYFYRLQAADFQETRKMVLMK
mgnify:CR=1 FL=1